MSNDNDLIAVIVEGAAEEAIMEVLLDNNCLKFTREELLEEKILRGRNARRFAKDHLNKALPKKLKIYRILDSTKEKFNLPKTYGKKVISVSEYYTQPEIEILHIINHGDYDEYSKKYKSSIKPSDYCKKRYSDLHNIKNGPENYNFWNNNLDRLINALKKYQQYSKDKEKTIASLLKK